MKIKRATRNRVSENARHNFSILNYSGIIVLGRNVRIMTVLLSFRLDARDYRLISLFINIQKHDALFCFSYAKVI